MRRQRRARRRAWNQRAGRPRGLRALVLGLALVLAATALVACQPDSAPPTAPTAPSSTSAQGGVAGVAPGPAPTEAGLVERASLLRRQHDLDAAEQLLRPMTDAAATAELDRVRADRAAAVVWPDNATISHLFWHSLIVDPARAFRGPQAAGYRDYMVTIPEFRRQLQQIYDRGYVLVHPQRIAAPDAAGVMRFQPITLPPGKKPLVISLDDLSYYEYMTGHGFATDLFVDTDGRVRNHYTDAAGHTSVGSYDLVPIVDDFVREHPDFSYRGDKGTIALTGYNGVLGYRTSVWKYGRSDTTTAQITAATQVAAAIREQGWRFASHSWGHIDLTKAGLGQITADARRWADEVQPIVGSTPSLIYAFGADIAGAEPYGNGNAKFRYLHGTQKFSYFFPIDASRPAWVQLTPAALRQARINVDGISLGRAVSGASSPLNLFFDPRSTLDPAR